MKKFLSLVLCMAFISTFFSGCKNNTPKTSSEDGKVTITVNNWPKETEKEMYAAYEGYKQRMKELYPNITIETQTGGYTVDGFFLNAASGQLPNLYVTYFTETQKIIDAGYAQDITESVKKYGYDTGTNPDALKLVTKDNKYYGIPFFGYNIGLWYNMNLMRQAGLVEENGAPKVPNTYQEVAEMSKIIKEKTGKAGFFISTKGTEAGWQFMNIAWSYGVDFEEKVNGKWKATFDSDEAVEAMQFFKDLKWKYDALPANNLVTRDDMYKLFAADEVAMAYYTPDMLPYPVLTFKMNKDDIAGSAVPGGPKGRYSQMGGNVWMISKESTPQQVDAILKWLAVKGDTPTLTEEAKTSMEAKVAADKAAGIVVMPSSFQMWTDEKRIREEKAIYEKYSNVSPQLWSAIDQAKDLTLREEEPVYCQELYAALANVMQVMMTNENADTKTELTKACAAFQKDYLDKAE